MRSGRETLASIEEALDDIKAQERRVQQELEEVSRERGEIAARRLEAFRSLATIRARNALADGVIDEADNLSGEVRTILLARLKTIEQLHRRRDEADAERASLVRKLDELNARIANLEEKLDHFAVQARDNLRNDAGYRSLVEEYGNISSMLEKATAKAEQVARDEEEKGRPYRSDTLFMYLWNRKFGTADYQASGLIRLLDEWVASLVRYSDARANYAMLTEIPIRLKSHAEQLGRLASETRAKLDEVERLKTQELAGGDLIAELKNAREEQTRQNGQLASVTAELTETGNQLGLYAKGEDQSLQDAVQRYAAFLEKETLQRLMSDAFSTRTREDDALVANIRELGGNLEALQRKSEDRRKQLDRLFDKRQELIRLSANFRRAHYEDTGSEFRDDPDLEDLLKLLVRGAISAAEYWARAESQQQWRRRPGDPWRRRSGLPPFEHWPTGWTGGAAGRSGRASRGEQAGSGRDFETGGSI